MTSIIKYFDGKDIQKEFIDDSQGQRYLMDNDGNINVYHRTYDDGEKVYKTIHSSNYEILHFPTQTRFTDIDNGDE